MRRPNQIQREEASRRNVGLGFDIGHSLLSVGRQLHRGFAPRMTTHENPVCGAAPPV
jgi:hypothetical protein